MKPLTKSIQPGLARIALGVILILAATTFGCDEKQLKAVAANTDRAALLIKDGREITAELWAQNIIDRDDAYKITVALLKVNSALRAFNNRAQTYKDAGGLTPEGKSLLKKLAEDISTAATALVADGTFGIKNRDAQIRINAAIGAIRQVALAIVDAVKALKTRAPVQQSGFDPITAISILLLALRQAMEFKAREDARADKTEAEVFADATAQINENDLALAADLVKYAPEGEVPAETQAQVDAIFELLATEPKE